MTRIQESLWWRAGEGRKLGWALPLDMSGVRSSTGNSFGGRREVCSPQGHLLGKGVRLGCGARASHLLPVALVIHGVVMSGCGCCGSESAGGRVAAMSSPISRLGLGMGVRLSMASKAQDASDQEGPESAPISRGSQEDGEEISLPNATKVGKGSRSTGWLASLIRGQRPPVGILGEVLKNQVEVLASALWTCGWRSFWVQLLLSSLSVGILLLSAMMQINTALALAPDVSVTSLLWGAVEQGLAAASTSLIFSIAHLAWTVGYLRGSRRVRIIAERSAQDGVEPLLAKFAGLTKSLNLGTTLGVAGAVAACIGMEQLLGTMVVRMLLAKGIGFSFWLTNPPARLQAVDIFAMQANVLVLGSHLAGLYFTHKLRISVPVHSLY